MLKCRSIHIFRRILPDGDLTPCRDLSFLHQPWRAGFAAWYGVARPLPRTRRAACVPERREHPLLPRDDDLQHEQRAHHLPPRHGQSDRVLNAFDRRRPARLLLFGQLLVHVPDGDSAWAGRGLR